MNPPVRSTRSQKKTPKEIAKAALRLRRQLENSLLEYDGSYAERRFVKAMVDLLYSVGIFDRDVEIIIDSVRNLTSKKRLRGVFSRSTLQWSPTGSPIYERWLCVPSPSEQFSN